MLSATIEIKHNCKAIHMESVPVREEFDGNTIWDGTVEVFALVGHPDSRRCFAWVEVPNDLQFQFITMLQKGFIVSPERAVKAWLASRPVTVHPVVGEKSNAQRTFHHEELHR